MNIFVIRHGQTTGDVENRYGGAYDDHLSDEGILQGKELAQILANSGIEKLYTSTYLRAQETTALLRETLRCAVEIVDDLKERNQYGHLTGMLKNEAQEKYPQDVESLKGKMNTLPNAESYENFSQRISNAFDTIVTKSPNRTIGIVWHGGPMRVLFRDILKWGELKEIGNCCFVTLEKTKNVYLWKNAHGVVPSFTLA